MEGTTGGPGEDIEEGGGPGGVEARLDRKAIAGQIGVDERRRPHKPIPKQCSQAQEQKTLDPRKE